MHRCYKNDSAKYPVLIKRINKNIIIKNLAGIFICCSFLLSITPKQVLHNVLANHKDAASKQLDARTIFHQAGFNCDCDNVVATSPFIEIASTPDVLKSLYYTSHIIPSREFVSIVPFFSSDLRGPPVC
ncbi:MAG: hypothetical protein QM737_19275 [Ferruginibacter sp.]